MPVGTYSWWNCSLMQIAGVISAVIVLIVILAIGFLLEPLQKVFVNFTLHFLHLPKTGLLQESLKVFIGFGGSQTGFCKAWFFFQDHDRERTTTFGPSKGIQVPKHKTSQHQFLGVKSKWDLRPQVRHLLLTMAREVPVQWKGHPASHSRDTMQGGAWSYSCTLALFI